MPQAAGAAGNPSAADGCLSQKYHMSELNESAAPTRQNPLIWISLIVAGLILFVFVSGERDDSGPGKIQTETKTETEPETEPEIETSGNIERSLLVPPGMRARQYIAQLRDAGKPYPLAEVHQKAEKHMADGSLADAHLLYFFAAREDHLPSILVLGEMSDPTLFRAEDSLLDHADVIQAYKCYEKAAALGDMVAAERIGGLQQWASDASQAENPHARQLLLNLER